MKTTRFLKLTAVILLAAVTVSLLNAAGPQATKTVKLTHKQLLWLIAHAETPSQQEQLAMYYRQLARRLLQQAKEQQQMANACPQLSANASKHPGVPSLAANHCAYWAELYAKQAKDAEALAALHEKIAKEAPGGKH